MAQVLSAFTFSPTVIFHGRILFDSLLHSLLLPLPPVCHRPSSSTSSCSLSSTTRSSWQTCAAPLQKRVRTPLNAFTSNTGYELKLLTFSELNDSPVPFSFMIPSTDQDVDDVTLGEMLTEAHEDKSTIAYQKACQSSQSSSVRFDGSGQPDGERNVDQSVNFGVPRNTFSAHSNFSDDIQIERIVDRSGKLDERNSSKAQIRTVLEEQKQTVIAEYREKSVITNSMQLTQKKSSDSYKGQLWQQKLEFREAHHEVLQK